MINLHNCQVMQRYEHTLQRDGLSTPPNQYKYYCRDDYVMIANYYIGIAQYDSRIPTVIKLMSTALMIGSSNFQCERCTVNLGRCCFRTRDRRQYLEILMASLPLYKLVN